MRGWGNRCGQATTSYHGGKTELHVFGVHLTIHLVDPNYRPANSLHVTTILHVCKHYLCVCDHTRNEYYYHNVHH